MTSLQPSVPRPSPAYPPKPRPYHMTEPTCERGVCTFWLTADEAVLEFVSHLPCVFPFMGANPFLRRPVSRALVTINPRYDSGEVCRWIQALLDAEAVAVELDAPWEEAIAGAFGDPDTIWDA
jgi:hypothetical protein